MTVRKDSEEKPLETPSSEESGLGASGEGTPDGSEPEAALVVPPDGGWGWVVVVASFLCNLIVDGIIFSTGFITNDIRKTFDVAESQVGAVGSIQQGFYLMAGPVVSAIANKFGFRSVTIVGSIVAAAGFALSYFASSIMHLYLTFGVISGIGFCMIYLPAVITVGFYFERWRALATGLALCGSGVGTFIIAPITQELVNKYGWSTTMLVQAGIVLICTICGAMFRPIKPIRIKIKNDDYKNSEKGDNKLDKEDFISKIKEKLDSGISEQIGHGASAHTWMGVENNTKYPTVAEVFSHKLERRRSTNAIILRDHILKPKFDVNPTTLNESEENDKLDNITPLISRKPPVEPVVRPFYRDDILYHGSLQRLPAYKSHNSLGYHLSVTHLPTSNDIKEERTGKCRLCPEAIRRTLFTMLDFDLFKSPTFVLLALSGMFTMLGFFVPYSYVVKRASDNDMVETKWLIPTIGIANIAGRIACGLISSVERVSPLWVNNIALTIGGLATVFSGFSMNVYMQHIYCAIFGLSVACFASLRSILVVDYMGLDRLTNSFGLLLLFQGIGALLGTPIAGALKDMTGTLEASFYLAGGSIVLSALLCFPLDVISRWEKDNKKNGHMPSV